MKKSTTMFTVILMLVFSANGFAECIRFVHSGTGSGTIGGVEFTDAIFTITGEGNTNDRYSFSTGYWINHDSASIVIEDLGGFQFISGTRTFVNNDTENTGFARWSILPATGADLCHGSMDPLLANWDMLTSIGPITGNSSTLLQWGRSPQIETDGGILLFDTQQNIKGSFIATVIPEPSILALLSISMASLLVCRWRWG